MKVFPTLLLCASLVGCASSMPAAPGDPGYFDAEIKVVGMKYLDDDNVRELFSIQDDGVVIAGGKPICRAVGTEIQATDGTIMLNVAPDGTVTGSRAPPEARFNSRNQLVTRDAIVSMVKQQSVGRRAVGHGEGVSADESRSRDARMVLLREGSAPVPFRGHFVIFDRRATRVALLLATVLLMKPGALGAPTQTAPAP